MSYREKRFLGHEWADLPIIFTSDEVANRITSDPKIVIHGNECIISFLTRYLMFWTLNSAQTIINRWFRRGRLGQFFLI